MKHIRLKSPYRKGYERTPREFCYSTSEVFYLPKPEFNHKINFFNVLDSRCSRREVGIISTYVLSLLLWYVAKIKSTYKEKSGFIWQHRSTPSGGGRHPVDLLIIRYKNKKPIVELYDPLGHALVRINVADQTKLKSFLTKVDRIVSFSEGALFWLVGQFDRTMSKYANGESIVWLDAGALLENIYLVAEAFYLNCCAIGITGEPWVSGFLRSNYLAEGLCGCVIGSRPKLSYEFLNI